VGLNGVGPWSSRSAIKGGRCEGIRFYWREWEGGILREETSSGSEWRVGMNLVLIPVSRCDVDEEAKRDRIGGIGKAWGTREDAGSLLLVPLSRRHFPCQSPGRI